MKPQSSAEVKKKESWLVNYNQDENNLPSIISLWDCNGSKQVININEIILKYLEPMFMRVEEEGNKKILFNDFSFAFREILTNMEFELAKLKRKLEKGVENNGN